MKMEKTPHSEIKVGDVIWFSQMMGFVVRIDGQKVYGAWWNMPHSRGTHWYTMPTSGNIFTHVSRATNAVVCSDIITKQLRFIDR